MGTSKQRYREFRNLLEYAAAYGEETLTGEQWYEKHSYIGADDVEVPGWPLTGHTYFVREDGAATDNLDDVGRVLIYRSQTPVRVCREGITLRETYALLFPEGTSLPDTFDNVMARLHPEE